MAVQCGKVGVIGAGKMAGALVRGWVNSGVLQPQQIMASVPKQDAALLTPLIDMGCKSTFSNQEVGGWADLILLGVKPSIIAKVAPQLTQKPKGDQLIVSIAAGICLDRLQSTFGDQFRVVRVMPNTPVEVQCGASVYSAGSTTTPADHEMVERLFSSVGKCWRVAESQIDAVTGISGSGPAYMYLILEALTEEGVRQGLSIELARSLAAQTMLGSGKMAGSRSPAQLRAEVTSPAGSTAEAVRSLEKGGLRFILMEAVAAAADKCRQIGS